MALVDDLGAAVPLAGPARRVVSLVPSITEALATTVAERLVGATDWCTRPAGLDVVRVRGTKNPDLGVVRSLHPDLVVANQEENRELDVRRLRDAGVAVWVTRIETLDEAFASLRRLVTEALAVPVPEWLTAAEREWTAPAAAGPRVVVAVWRDPWMVVGPRTFSSDLLGRLGAANAVADTADRYPAVTPADVVALRPDVVVLPDEPYAFAVDDGPEAFPGLPTALVEGRRLTWYGPSLVGARSALDTALAAALGAPDTAGLVAVAEADRTSADDVRDTLTRLLQHAPELGIATALGILSRSPRYKPSTGLLVDPAGDARRRWDQRVAAASVLLADPAAARVRELAREDVEDDPELAADVAAAVRTANGPAPQGGAGP